MKKTNLMLAAFTVMFFLFAGSFANSNNLYAQDNGVVIVQSQKSFDETVSELRQMVAKNGMMVLAEINHGKILSMTGIDVKGLSLFVGNPQIGKQLFNANRGVGLAVPIRLNVFEGSDGKVYVNYVKPSYRLNSFNDKTISKIAQMLDQKIGMLTSMISK